MQHKGPGKGRDTGHGKRHKVNPISWDIGYIAAHSKRHPLGFKF
jgi:hypothetical protein